MGRLQAMNFKQKEKSETKCEKDSVYHCCVEDDGYARKNIVGVGGACGSRQQPSPNSL